MQVDDQGALCSSKGGEVNIAINMEYRKVSYPINILQREKTLTIETVARIHSVAVEEVRRVFFDLPQHLVDFFTCLFTQNFSIRLASQASQHLVFSAAGSKFFYHLYFSPGWTDSLISSPTWLVVFLSVLARPPLIILLHLFSWLHRAVLRGRQDVQIHHSPPHVPYPPFCSIPPSPFPLPTALTKPTLPLTTRSRLSRQIFQTLSEEHESGEHATFPC